MKGKIIKGIAGFYYVHTEKGIFECKAKGAFRKEKVKPLVGDNVQIELLDEGQLLGNIKEILPRKNALIRPASANIDQALVIFAIVKPDPNYNLLDRFLILMQKQEIPTVICFNKKDLASEKEQEELLAAYRASGCEVLFVSGREEEGIDRIREILRGKTTVVAGPSGVGKSTIVNSLTPIWRPERSAARSNVGNIPPAMQSCLPSRQIPILWIRRALPPCILKEWKRKN